MSYYRQGPFRGPGGGVTIGVPSLTPMVRAIMIACGAVWLVQYLGYRMLGRDVLSQWLGLVPANLLGYLWQPFSYMWLHSPATIFHVFFNMLFLWLLGSDLERRWGSRGFLRYYLVCGIGAAPFIILAGLASRGAEVASLVGGDPASIPTIGASGAVYGIILAYGMVFADRTILFMLIFPMRARTFAIVLFVIAFFSTLDTRSVDISHVAHLGGMVVGYLYLKRAWRVGEFYRELRWKVRRRRFRVIPPRDDDPWVN